MSLEQTTKNYKQISESDILTFVKFALPFLYMDTPLSTGIYVPFLVAYEVQAVIFFRFSEVFQILFHS